MNALRNKVQLIGNLGMDPEIKDVNSKKLATFSLATKEDYKDQKGEKVENTQWHRIAAWGNLAEIIEKHLNKGDEIAIEGRLSHRQYEDKNGDKKYITEVVANELLMLRSKKNTAQQATN
ncbi:MAG: single-stranded DNA-binding protein [Bacteroidota bacterium]